MQSSHHVEVHVPKVYVVETAAVAKRLAGRTLAARASKRIINRLDANEYLNVRPDNCFPQPFCQYSPK
jgi:hypothetical protein